MGAAPLRVVVETQVWSDSEWRVSEVDAGRLSGVLDTNMMALHLNESLNLTGRRREGRSSTKPREPPNWPLLRAEIVQHLERRAREILVRDWPSGTAPSPPVFRVALRALIMSPDIDIVESASHDWLDVIPLPQAIAKVAAALKADDVTVTSGPFPLSLAPGAGTVPLSMKSSADLIVERIVVAGVVADAGEGTSEKALWEQKVHRPVQRSETSVFAPFDLPAEVLRSLGAEEFRKFGPVLLVYAVGRSAPFRAQLPAAHLPPPETCADLMLDLGSTNTKWVLRLPDGTLKEHDQDTVTLARTWGVAPYDKKRFVADGTGEQWCDWVAAALPRLRSWTGIEHKAYLRNVILALPATREFDVFRISNKFRDDRTLGDDGSGYARVSFRYPVGQESSVTVKGSFDEWGDGVQMHREGCRWGAIVEVVACEKIEYRFVLDNTHWVADPAYPPSSANKNKNSELELLPVPVWAGRLKEAMTTNLAAGGRVILRSEHSCVAHQYLSVLGILKLAAERFTARYNANEKERAGQAAALHEWARAERTYQEHCNKFFLARWFSSTPQRPGGKPVSLHAKLPSPLEWMKKLVSQPERFARVVIMDFGGLSLDIAVLEGQKLCQELSHSDSTCGGEALSLAIGRKLGGPQGTRYKAQLGIQWEQTQDLSIQPQREYRDTTRRLLCPPFCGLVDKLRSRWGSSLDCWFLVTGGGSKNPHMREYLKELASEYGLDAEITGSPDITALLHVAKGFSSPLPELQSREVSHFEAAVEWSNRREQQRSARYDKFAIVGGMCALTGEREFQ